MTHGIDVSKLFSEMIMVSGYSINMIVVISITCTRVGWCHNKSSPEEARLPLSK